MIHDHFPRAVAADPNKLEHLRRIAPGIMDAISEDFAPAILRVAEIVAAISLHDDPWAAIEQRKSLAAAIIQMTESHDVIRDALAAVKLPFVVASSQAAYAGSPHV